MQGEVIVMKEVLNVGPIKKEEGQKFSDLRSAFWQDVVVNEKNPIVVDDLERLLNITSELSKNPKHVVWLWVAPLPADICMYLWAIKYLLKYANRAYVINIAGLPFLDEEGKLFFPKSISEISAKELVKAKHLARPISKTEFETDGEEWEKLTTENTLIRIHEGGKKIIAKSEHFYDSVLLSFCTYQFQKASKIVGQAITKSNIPTGDLFLGWRLRKISETGKLIIQGDKTGKLKDFEVKLLGEEQQLELAI